MEPELKPNDIRIELSSIPSDEPDGQSEIDDYQILLSLESSKLIMTTSEYIKNMFEELDLPAEKNLRVELFCSIRSILRYVEYLNCRARYIDEIKKIPLTESDLKSALDRESNIVFYILTFSDKLNNEVIIQEDLELCEYTMDTTYLLFLIERGIMRFSESFALFIKNKDIDQIDKRLKQIIELILDKHLIHYFPEFLIKYIRYHELIKQTETEQKKSWIHSISQPLVSIKSWYYGDNNQNGEDISGDIELPTLNFSDLVKTRFTHELVQTFNYFSLYQVDISNTLHTKLYLILYMELLYRRNINGETIEAFKLCTDRNRYNLVQVYLLTSHYMFFRADPEKTYNEKMIINLTIEELEVFLD